MPRKRKPSRRDRGSGYITTTPAGKSKAHYPKAAGGYYTKVFDSPALAQTWLADLGRQTKAKIQLADGRQTLATWLDAWLHERATDPDSPIKAKTEADYAYKLGYASAQIGHLAIADITIDDIDETIRTLRHSLAATTTSQIRNLLDQAFTEAVRRRYIPFSPAVKTTRKTKQPRKKTPIRLTFQEAATLLQTTTDPRLHTMLWLLLCLPLRAGEILGLRRSDLDLANGTLTINQAAIDLRGKVAISTPKTADSVRTLPIPAAVLPLIEAQLSENVRRAKRYQTWYEHTLVFPSRRGTPQGQSRFLAALKRAYESAGLDRRMGAHHLRHTASAFYTAIDAPRVVRAALAGHSQDITDYYGKADIATLRRWVEQVSSRIEKEITEIRQTGT